MALGTDEKLADFFIAPQVMDNVSQEAVFYAPQYASGALALSSAYDDNTARGIHCQRAAVIFCPQLTMPSNPHTSLASFWCHWILANATAIGTANGIGRFIFPEEVSFARDETLLVFGLLSLGFVLVGFAQQLLLWPWLHYVDYWALLMPMMFLIGIFLGWPSGWLLSALIQAIVPFPQGWLGYWLIPVIHDVCLGLAFGVGFGFLQALYVGKTPRDSFRWMVVSGSAVSAGVFIHNVALRMAEGRPQFSDVGSWALAGTAAGAVYGLITGSALVLMLRQHDSYPVKMRY
jgi:hypothetical protein